jgi:hypothetical protein
MTGSADEYFSMAATGLAVMLAALLERRSARDSIDHRLTRSGGKSCDL